jgi:zinc transport system substrate-binding protein
VEVKKESPENTSLYAENKNFRVSREKHGVLASVRHFFVVCTPTDDFPFHHDPIPSQMRSRTPRFLVLLPFCLLIIGGCAQKRPPSETKLRIVASIAPLGSFAAEIAGSRADVLVVVPPGMNPHVFDLTPELLRQSSDADVLLLNGAGLEFWADKLRENIRTPALAEVVATEGMTLLGGHEHGNPHFWLDPVLAMDGVRRICDVLIRKDSSHAEWYRANTQRLLDSLELLHAEILREVATWRHRTFIANHATWDYFAKRYDLQELATLESIPGRDISPREMADIIRLMKTTGTTAIFAETLSSMKAVEMLAAETGARYAVLDPLGSPQTATRYLDLMRFNLRRMSEIMR